jgi:branched-chain amino acid transport system substrate-binding protein
MKKIYALCTVCLLAAVTAILVYAHNPSGPADVQSEPITIGALLPLTGNSASIGERVKQGVDLALEEVNRSGNKLRVVYEDDKGETASAITAARKLIHQDHARILIGPLKSDPLLAVAPITEQDKVILFSPTAGAAKISEAGDYVFRNIENPDVHGNGAATFLKEQHTRNVAIFASQASNAQSYASTFKAAWTKMGYISYESNYATDATDFRAEITKAIITTPDAIYIGVGTAKDAGLLIKQLREQGFVGLIVASVAADAKELVDTAGQAAEGVYIVSVAFNPLEGPAKAYNELYRQKYGKDSEGLAANGYDAVMILAQAAVTCQKSTIVSTDCVRDFIYNTKNYPGVAGNTTFDKNGDVLKPVLLKQVQHGTLISIKLLQ